MKERLNHNLSLSMSQFALSWMNQYSRITSLLLLCLASQTMGLEGITEISPDLSLCGWKAGLINFLGREYLELVLFSNTVFVTLGKCLPITGVKSEYWRAWHYFFTNYMSADSLQKNTWNVFPFSICSVLSLEWNVFWVLFPCRINNKE